MPDNNSPWGSGGSGGSNGGGGKSPWGTGGNRPPRKPGSGSNANNEIDNVVRGLKDKFGGGGGPVKRNGPGGGTGIPKWAIPAAILAALAVTSVFTVQAEEQAVVLRFGEYKRTVGPGLHFKLPLPFETKIKRSVTNQQETNIGQRNKKESLMLTGDENIVDVEFTVLWRINDLEKYLFEIDDPKVAVKAVAESVMREVIGQNELNQIITTEREKLRGSVQEQVQAILDEYNAGVKINDVQFQKTDPPTEVNQAFLDVVNAEQQAESLINGAQAYQNKAVLEAEGAAARMIQDAEAYKEQITAEATGEAERFRLVYEEYKKSPRVIRQRMHLDNMNKIYRGGTKIIMDSDASSGVVPYLPLNELAKTGGK